MKANKGFTLIELLAVIVILAIIALIATPMILNVIDRANQGAKENSAYGYIDAAEKQISLNLLDGTTQPTEIVDPAFVTVKGEQPTSVSLDLSNGVVTNGIIRFGTGSDAEDIKITDGKAKYTK